MRLKRNLKRKTVLPDPEAKTAHENHGQNLTDYRQRKLYSAQLSLTAFLIYAGNEPKSVLARDLGDCRDNLRNSQSVFLIVACIQGKHGLYDNTWKIQCTDRYQ